MKKNCLERLFIIRAYNNLVKQCDRNGRITRFKARKAISYTRLDRHDINMIIDILVDENLVESEDKRNIKVLNKVYC